MANNACASLDGTDTGLGMRRCLGRPGTGCFACAFVTEGVQHHSFGTAVLLVEQDARSTLAIAEEIYVLEHGRVVRQGSARALANDDEIRRIYLGV